MEKITLNTPLGLCVVEADELGITKISVTDETAQLNNITIVNPFLIEAEKQLKAYFDGNLQIFNLTINPKGTDFQKKVWQALLKVPYGKTASYQEITNSLGDPKAIRAVANANGKNPLWIVVPCHRIIGSDGSLTGYAGGLWRKKWLLENENPVKQQSLF
jgi:methylated-DNA-[protein]-cysteine S-methyltransferase